MFPVEVRSTLLGNISFGLSVVLLIMVQVYNFAFKKFGSSSPFLIAAFIDILLFVSVFVLSNFGLIETRGTAEKLESLSDD